MSRSKWLIPFQGDFALAFYKFNLSRSTACVGCTPIRGYHIHRSKLTSNCFTYLARTFSKPFVNEYNTTHAYLKFPDLMHASLYSKSSEQLHVFGMDSAIYLRKAWVVKKLRAILSQIATTWQILEISTESVHGLISSCMAKLIIWVADAFLEGLEQGKARECLSFDHCQSATPSCICLVIERRWEQVWRKEEC